MKIDVAALDALFATRSLGAPEHAVGFVLWRLVHRYQREVDRALAPLDLTHLQFTTLAMTAWQCRAGVPVVQAELARAAAMHPMQVSQVLATLERKTLVARTRSDSDTRAKLVRISAAGIKALRAALPLAVAVQERLFGPAGAPGGKLLADLLAIEARAGED